MSAYLGQDVYDKAMSDIPRATTESQLREWRTGQAGAERLAATLLHIDGFVDVDPQAPLGGPDDKKDILCRLNDRTYVAAVYFPANEKSAGEVRRKFEEDLEGAVRHNRDGIVFVTNQHIGLAERTTLEDLAAARGKLCIIFHRERIRALLDSPTGYGARLEYLHLPMKESEQIAYFAASGNKLEYALERHSREIRNLARKIDSLRAGQDYAAHTVAAIAERLGERVPPPPATVRADPVDTLEAQQNTSPMSAALSAGFLLAVHRLACGDLPLRLRGRFRTQNVWIGHPGAPPEEGKETPHWDQIEQRIDDLLTRWNDGFSALSSAGDDQKLEAVAAFHHSLLFVHPFLDGNGRTARAILIQQCVDLFGHIDPDLIDKGATYYDAIFQADSGNLEPLKILIKRAITL